MLQVACVAGGGKLQGILMMITGGAVKVQKVLEAARWALRWFTICDVTINIVNVF